MPFYAHSQGANGEWELLAVHLKHVATLAAEFASQFGEDGRAFLLGILHDLGKYGDLFQRRLHNQEKGVDHWSLGAWVALQRFRQTGLPMALAIEGHHIGLQQATRSSLQNLNPTQPRPEGSARLSEQDPEVLLSRLAADGIALPVSLEAVAPPRDAICLMAEVRMLFSALTDADFLATEEHFDPDTSELRRTAWSLDAPALSSRLLAHLEKVRRHSCAAATVSGVRDDLLAACLDAAQQPAGVYTLTAPTGAGKTLALLRFALEHARLNNLRRVVAILPYLSIIDQTAAVYRQALENDESVARLLVLEDHSLADTGVLDDDGAAVAQSRQRALLAENWDAPVVVTTSVQFLESLFSNSPAACRKLHRLANSIVILDEVQTLPLKVAIPTLAVLAHLSKRYRISVVFSTATQPAFDHLDGLVKGLVATGWCPREIVPPSLNLYRRSSRVFVNWPAEGERHSMKDLAGSLASLSQALCIVNVKRDARELFQTLESRREDDLFHLSTDMCPEHRKAVLAAIRERLGMGQPCLVVATQCVEAGVDLDFPVVYRALAPLDAIAQAAGRCNRNGRLAQGQLHVFVPADARYPSADYRQAAALTAEMLAQARGRLDLDDPGVFRAYYRRLYSVASLEDQNPELMEAIKALNFAEVRKHYKIVENAASINVLTAYDLAKYAELSAIVRENGLNRRWIASARAFTVSLFRPLGGHRINDYLEPIRLRDRSPARDWFIHLRPEHYHRKLGLQVPKEMEFMNV